MSISVEWRELIKGKGYGFNTFIDWVRLVNPANGFLIDGHQLTVECELATPEVTEGDDSWDVAQNFQIEFTLILIGITLNYETLG
jgi:hypothetical protein